MWVLAEAVGRYLVHKGGRGGIRVVRLRLCTNSEAAGFFVWGFGYSSSVKGGGLRQTPLRFGQNFWNIAPPLETLGIHPTNLHLYMNGSDGPPC
jgi:hypothetical protein